MEPVEINDPAQIQEMLKSIVLTGNGFTTECLLVDVFEAGLTYPDYFKAMGEDPTAFYDGKAPAWESYHLRQGKKVFMVYGMGQRGRRIHIAETP
uniref:Uncharacterized protein n=1 Tax=Leptospirillum ferriphilum TaxID=178606 RepID=A0A7C3QUU8_9BACT